MRNRRNERGAAAVEFALVFPLVIMLLLTVIEFSRLWNVQATISDAARISARYAAVHGNDPLADEADVIAEATDRAKAVPGLVDWSTATISVSIDCDAEDGIATSTISVAPGSITQWFGSAIGTPITLEGKGVMTCGG